VAIHAFGELQIVSERERGVDTTIMKVAKITRAYYAVLLN
jgi:hypothetical protein